MSITYLNTAVDFFILFINNQIRALNTPPNGKKAVRKYEGFSVRKTEKLLPTSSPIFCCH